MYDIFPLQLLEFHHSMLQDRVRMQTHLSAILQIVRPGDVVLDIGCGTGVLSFFACMAGARRVYAVEHELVIHAAESLARENGYQDRVVFIHDLSTAINLPEEVDVIVSETIGNLGFEEGILGWVLDARNRFLREDGRILPWKLEMILAPIQHEKAYKFHESWGPDFYGLDFTPLREMAVNNLYWAEIREDSYLSRPQTLFQVDFLTFDAEDLEGGTTFELARDGVLHGLGGWFAAELVQGVSLSNAPPLATPSWNHRLLPVSRPLAVRSGDVIELVLRTRDNALIWEWEVTLRRRGVVLDRQSQSSARGQINPVLSSQVMKRRLIRNTDGEVDYFLLANMNGHKTIEELARQAAGMFPARFPDDRAAAAYILSRLADFGYSVYNTQAG